MGESFYESGLEVECATTIYFMDLDSLKQVDITVKVEMLSQTSQQIFTDSPTALKNHA